MKKTIIAWCFLSIGFQWVSAQKSALYSSENRLFREAVEMFNDANYSGCAHKLAEYKKTASDSDFIQEADWLNLVCNYKQGRTDVGLQIKEYLEDHPDSRHKDQAYLYIGSSHFMEQDFLKTIFWLEKVELDNLPETEQDDYAYRMAYARMQAGENEEARRLFGLLMNNKSEKYAEVATYYYAYLDYLDGDYTHAEAVFETLKNNLNFRSSVLYYLTQIHYLQGDYNQAIPRGEAVLKEFYYSEHNAEVHRILGNSYYKRGNKEKAIEHLSRYSAQTPNAFREDLYLLGLAYYESGNYPAAVLYLSRSTETNDAVGQNAYLYLGHAYLKTGDKNRARMSFEAASRVDFDAKIKEAAAYNYAMLLHEVSASAFGESVTVLENFLNDFPNSMYADQVNNCLAEVYLTTKNYEAALTSINKIKQPGMKILEARQKIYYHLGVNSYVNSQYEEAVSWFSKAILEGSYAPLERANAQYWRGESYFRMKNYVMAQNDYKVFLAPGRPGDARLTTLANYNLGYCYFNQMEYGSAATWFDKYISLEKDRSQLSLADAYARRGDCYFHHRQFSEAERAYQEAFKLQPENGAYPLFQSGFVLGLKRDYNGKIAQMEKLIEKYPESPYLPEALYEKGRTHVLLNKENEAIAAFSTLLAQYPQSSVARKAGTQIGLLYFNQNKLPQSAEAYKRVINDYPGTEEAQVAIQDLKSVYLEMNDVNAYIQYVNSLGGVKLEISEQDSLTYLAAENFFMRGDEVQAQKTLQTYLQSFPQGAFALKAHYYLGIISYNQNDYDAARKAFTQVLSIGHTEFSEESLVRMGYMEYSQKDYSAAIVTYGRLSKVAERKENRITAYLGTMRSASFLNKDIDVINAANSLLKETNLSHEQTAEAKYNRAKAYLAINDGSKAVADLKDLGSDTRTAFGAEARYLLGQYYLDTKQTERAEAEADALVKSGSPHAYWLARGFILLSDINAAKGDDFLARQYLESLTHNYNGEDDILNMIEERMLKLKK